MRKLAIALVLLGLVLLGGGLFFGCGFYAQWDGRSVILERPVTPGTPVSADVDAMVGRRYTFSARVEVDGREVSEEEASKGASAIELQMPFAMRLSNSDGQGLQTQVGFLSQEPPTLVYGDPTGGTSGRGGRGVVAERFLGPYPSGGPQKLHVDLDLGEDRLGRVRIADAKLVVYDDAIPSRIRRPFAAAGMGLLALMAGVVAGLFAVARRRLRLR
jgi:hypothetical protein